MRIRYGSEMKRLQQERNLLLWAFILLAILTLLLMWQYEVRIEQLERLHQHPQGTLAPAREFDSFRPRRGLFLSGADTPRLRKHRGRCNRPHGRGLRLSGE